MFEPSEPVTTPNEVKDILGEDFESQVLKVIDHIDDHCGAWINRSPFVVVSSSNSRGQVDVSPKGDPAGFVVILDKHTLAIPDRIGNHRGDTFLNVLENPRVGLMFIVPKRKEVVRVSGTAKIAKDKELLERMSVKGKNPDLALVVRVEEAFFHCGKSMIRSHMWEPEKWGEIEGLPSYARAIKDQANSPKPIEELEKMMANNETDRLY